jgi:hypothetical protein
MLLHSFSAFIFWLIHLRKACFGLASSQKQSLKDLDSAGACHLHCRRLLDRSLDRIGYDTQKVFLEFSNYRLLVRNEHLKQLSLVGEIDKTGRQRNFRDICWKFFDYTDCTKMCDTPSAKTRRKRQKNGSEKVFQRSTRLLIKSCQTSMNKETLENFQCIHKYHTFLSVQCSSYAKEALNLRRIAREDKRRRARTAKSTGVITKNNNDREKYQETCRFLHYHTMCLSNSVFQYCPLAAKDLFNRFTLRDYFLSFVLPVDDELFSDPFLDHCQLYDFQKMAKDVYDSTKKPTTTKRSLLEYLVPGIGEQVRMLLSL